MRLFVALGAALHEVIIMKVVSLLVLFVGSAIGCSASEPVGTATEPLTVCFEADGATCGVAATETDDAATAAADADAAPSCIQVEAREADGGMEDACE